MRKFFVLLCCTILSLLFCGSGVGLAIEAPVVDPNPDQPNPASPDVNNLGSPDGKGAGQGLSNTEASATSERQGGIADDEYDPDVVKYKAAKYVLLNAARTIATQRKVKTYEVTHFRIGEESLILTVTENIPAGETVTLTSENVQGNLGLLGVSSTLFVRGVDGYEVGSKTKTDGGDLELYVVKADEDMVRCRPVNGIAKVEGTVSDRLSDYTCPAIPAGTELIVGMTACSESQMTVAPDNSQPRPETVYLQKGAFNIIITDHEREIIKKTQWGLKEIKEQALGNFSKKGEYNLWLGQQRRFLMKQPKGNDEYVYTARGILRQLTNTLGVDGKFKWEHITAIGKIQFTNFAESKEAYAYCGKNKIAEINNMEQVLHHETEYKHRKTDYGVVIRDLVSTFGTLHVVHAPALDDFGMSDFMVVVDMPNARYYNKVKHYEKTNDLKNNGDEAREAEIYMYIESGALALRGYNSMLVGPSDKIASRNLSTSANPVTMVDSLPTNPADGMIITFDGLLSADGPVEKVSELPANPQEGDIIAPTVDITVDDVTYSSDLYYIYEDGEWTEYDDEVLDGDKVYRYNGSTGKWEEYTGNV